MFEEQLLAEFSAGLRDEANDKLNELPADLLLASETALAEVILGYLEEAGSIASHDLCPHEDVGLHRPCRVIAYSLPDDSVRLELFTTLGVNSEPVLARREIARLSGWAARFFEYAAKGDHARFENNPAALEAAALIQIELPRIEEVRVKASIIATGFRERCVHMCSFFVFS